MPGSTSRIRSQTSSSSRPLWKNSSLFSTPPVMNDATISQYVSTIRYDAFSSDPGGQSVARSAAVFGLKLAENHLRASRNRGSRRDSYSVMISRASS